MDESLVLSLQPLAMVVPFPPQAKRLLPHLVSVEGFLEHQGMVVTSERMGRRGREEEEEERIEEKEEVEGRDEEEEEKSHLS